MVGGPSQLAATPISGVRIEQDRAADLVAQDQHHILGQQLALAPAGQADAQPSARRWRAVETHGQVDAEAVAVGVQRTASIATAGRSSSHTGCQMPLVR